MRVQLPLSVQNILDADRGAIISAIKQYRAETGCSLKDAKDTIDAYLAGTTERHMEIRQFLQSLMKDQWLDAFDACGRASFRKTLKDGSVVYFSFKEKA